MAKFNNEAGYRAIVLDYDEIGIIISALSAEIRRIEKSLDKRVGADSECVYSVKLGRVEDLYNSIIRSLYQMTTNEATEGVVVEQRKTCCGDCFHFGAASHSCSLRNEPAIAECAPCDEFIGKV